VLDLKALADLGLEQNAPITDKISGVSAETALKEMLRDSKLAYTVCGEVLLITSQDAADNKLLVRTYDVSDLPGFRTKGVQANPDFDSLIDTITSSIKPPSWDHVGGPGSVRPFYTGNIQALVVNNTWQVQEEISSLLNDLRKLQKKTPTKKK
jgi:hypothetical protein